MSCRRSGRTMYLVSTKHWLTVIAGQRHSTNCLGRVCSIRFDFLQSFCLQSHSSHLLHCSRRSFQLGCSLFSFFFFSQSFTQKLSRYFSNSIHYPSTSSSPGTVTANSIYKRISHRIFYIQNGVCIWFCLVRAHRAGNICRYWACSGWLWFAGFKSQLYGTC